MNVAEGSPDLWAIAEQVEELVAGMPDVDIEHVGLTKGGYNPQTTGDLRADQYLRLGLPAILDVPIMSEEDTTASPNRSGRYWVIDPIDGTLNVVAAAQIPYLDESQYYATSVALFDADRLQSLLGVVRVVVRSHAIDIYSAVAGQGARLNTEPLITNDDHLPFGLPEIVSFGVPGNSALVAERMANVLRQLYKDRWETRQLGSACVDICNVAKSQWSAFMEYGLKLWDIAAAALVAQEAGCAVEAVATDTSDPTKVPLTYDIIVARNRSVLRTLAQLSGIGAPK